MGLARAVEAELTTRGVDYAVEVEMLGRTTLFGSQRNAAVFYVTEGQAAWSRAALREANLGSGIVENGE